MVRFRRLGDRFATGLNVAYGKTGIVLLWAHYDVDTYRITVRAWRLVREGGRWRFGRDSRSFSVIEAFCSERNCVIVQHAVLSDTISFGAEAFVAPQQSKAIH